MDKSEAIDLVHPHVFPRECFITTDNGRDWRPINGTGCAHFVAHRRNIQTGVKGGNACIHGYAVSVRVLLDGLVPVLSVVDVETNDMWFNDAVFRPQAGKDHCGIVSCVSRESSDDPITEISITHCSNKQVGVLTNDWKEYFHGEGRFYRLPGL